MSHGPWTAWQRWWFRHEQRNRLVCRVVTWRYRHGLYSFPVRVSPWFPGSVYLVAGPWQAKLAYRPDSGRFSNGSRWFSGWHRQEAAEPF